MDVESPRKSWIKCYFTNLLLVFIFLIYSVTVFIILKLGRVLVLNMGSRDGKRVGSGRVWACLIRIILTNYRTWIYVLFCIIELGQFLSVTHIILVINFINSLSLSVALSRVRLFFRWFMAGLGLDTSKNLLQFRCENFEYCFCFSSLGNIIWFNIIALISHPCCGYLLFVFFFFSSCQITSTNIVEHLNNVKFWLKKEVMEIIKIKSNY